ncbi:MAG TPA: hypothetical protein VFA65_23970 [Bryobacteraceae bacterium]|nr:hypothetical protein [Bryobacteraceae bacterium]
MSLADQSAAATSYNANAASGVRLMPQLVNRLCARLETARSVPDGVSGLLFGTSQDDIIVVHAFRSLMDSEIAAIEAGELRLDDAVLALARTAETDPALAALGVLGWYAFRPVGGLQEADISFHNRQFAWMSDVVLIARRSDPGYLIFEFYARAREGLLTEEEHRWGASRLAIGQAVSGEVEITLRTQTEGNAASAARAQSAQSEDLEIEPRVPRHLGDLWEHGQSRPAPNERPPRSKASRSKPLIRAGELPGMLAPLIQSKRGNVPWFSSAILFAVFAGLTFAVLVLRGLPSGNSGSFWQAILPDTGLNMRVEGQGDRVLLSWNRRNAVVRAAAGAILHIDDGSQHRDVRLDASQAANGAVLYRPNSDDVSFRLEVKSQDGKTVAENLRVLDSTSRNQPLDVTAQNASGNNTAKPKNTAPIETSHVWQPIPTAKIAVNSLAPPRETPILRNPVQSIPKFDLSRLTTPVLPASSATPATIPPAAAAQNSPPPPSPQPKITEQTQSTSAPQNSTGDQPAGPVSQVPSKLPTETTPRTQQPTTNTAVPSGETNPVQSTLVQRYRPPKPIRQVLPDISILPRSLVASSPQIDVVVSVDEKGHVTRAQAQPQSGRKPAHAMVIAAETAAKNWVFEPALLDGRPVPSEHSIIFQFGSR